MYRLSAFQLFALISELSVSAVSSRVSYCLNRMDELKWDNSRINRTASVSTLFKSAYITPDRVKPSFVIFDNRALWRSALSSECPDVDVDKWRLNPVWHMMLYSCTHIATVGVKWLKKFDLDPTHAVMSSNRQLVGLLEAASSLSCSTAASKVWFANSLQHVSDALTDLNLYWIKGALAFVCFKFFFFWLRVLDRPKAEYSAFESTLNSSIVSYRIGYRRTTESTFLVVQSTRLFTVDNHAFYVVATRTWNSLPDFVTSASSLPAFKRHLKTLLFAISYPSLRLYLFVQFFLQSVHVRLFVFGFCFVRCSTSLSTSWHHSLLTNSVGVHPVVIHDKKRIINRKSVT